MIFTINNTEKNIIEYTYTIHNERTYSSVISNLMKSYKYSFIECERLNINIINFVL